MGKLTYGDSSEPLLFDDRTLWHLQLSIGMKLRRHESFFLTWIQTGDTGSTRHSIWLDDSVRLHFQYDTDAYPSANREWLEALSQSGATSQGMFLMPEPGKASD